MIKYITTTRKLRFRTEYKVFLILTVIYIAGCSSGCTEYCTEYSRNDRIARNIFLASQAMDMYTTRQVLQSGGYECNPLYSKHPTDKQLFIGKGIDTGIFLLLAEVFPKHRQTLFNIGSILRFSISYHNYKEN